jgi:hypothetical protein
MTRKRLISLGVALAAVLLTINHDQIEQNVIAIPEVWKPYILAVEAFVLTTAIPSLWRENGLTRDRHAP